MKRVTVFSCLATIGILASCAPAGNPTPPPLVHGHELLTNVVVPADDPCAPWLEQGVGCEVVTFPALEVAAEGLEGPRG